MGGKLNSVFAPGGLEGSKVRLHRLQAAARTSDTGVRIAQLLIGRKLLGQCQVLEWLTDPGQQFLAAERDRIQRMRIAATELHSLCDWVASARGLEEIMEAERSGGQVYWSVLAGIPLQWKPRDAGRSARALVDNPAKRII
jgi:CRISPR/Cas system-associated endonuclease Cas1